MFVVIIIDIKSARCMSKVAGNVVPKKSAWFPTIFKSGIGLRQFAGPYVKTPTSFCPTDERVCGSVVSSSALSLKES